MNSLIDKKHRAIQNYRNKLKAHKSRDVGRVHASKKFKIVESDQKKLLKKYAHKLIDFLRRGSNGNKGQKGNTRDRQKSKATGQSAGPQISPFLIQTPVAENHESRLISSNTTKKNRPDNRGKVRKNEEKNICGDSKKKLWDSLPILTKPKFPFGESDSKKPPSGNSNQGATDMNRSPNDRVGYLTNSRTTRLEKVTKSLKTIIF